jgi:hypothetical protein
MYIHMYAYTHTHTHTHTHTRREDFIDEVLSEFTKHGGISGRV